MWVAIASIYSLGMLLVAGGVLLRRAERAQAREAHARDDLMHIKVHAEEVSKSWLVPNVVPRTALTTTERGVTCH